MLFIHFLLLFLSICFSSAENHAKVGKYSFIDIKTCGLSKLSNEMQINARIVDGQNATTGEFPWMAVIVQTDGQQLIGDRFCGAVLIAKYFMLSSANCFYDKNLNASNYSVFMGSVDKYSGEKFNIRNIYVNPDYNPNTKKINDIALVEMETEIEPKIVGNVYSINNICLPKKNILNTKPELMIFCGWGAVTIDGQNYSQFLTKTEYNIPEYDSKICSAKQICHKVVNNSVCFGDTGSPLLQLDRNQAVIIGIQSFRRNSKHSEQCGAGQQQFTRVSQFIPWILSTIANKDRFQSTDENHSTEPTVVSGNDLIVIIVFFVIIVLIIIITIAFMCMIAVKSKIFRSKTQPTMRSSDSDNAMNVSNITLASITTVDSQTGSQFTTDSTK